MINSQKAGIGRADARFVNRMPGGMKKSGHKKRHPVNNQMPFLTTLLTLQ